MGRTTDPGDPRDRPARARFRPGHRQRCRAGVRSIGRRHAGRHRGSHQYRDRPGAQRRDRRGRLLHTAPAAAGTLRRQGDAGRLQAGRAEGDRGLGRRHQPRRHQARGRRTRGERHRLGRDAAGRDVARDARDHDRSAEGRGTAAQRPQFHAIGHAHSGRQRPAPRSRRCGRRCHAGRFRRRHLRVQRQRHAQPVQQLPARRRQQQRHLQHRLRDAAAARRDPGIQDSDALVQRGVRPQRRLGRQRRHEGGLEPGARRGLGVQSRRPVPGAQLLRADDAEAQAEPVRRQPGWTDREEPVLRIRLLRGLPQHARQHDQHPGPDGRPAAGRLFRQRGDQGSVDRCRLPGQRDSRRSHQPGVTQATRPVRAQGERQPHERRAVESLRRLAGNERQPRRRRRQGRLPGEPDARRARALHADADRCRDAADYQRDR